jgi:SAM-dependent methyltransferase
VPFAVCYEPLGSVVVLDYSREASHYDATRGGDKRADAAADAVSRLLPPPPPVGATTVLDVGCGTGIVTMRLVADGRDVIGVERAEGMLAIARTRLPGRVVRGDATRLPVADGSVDAVVTLWLLHLLDPEQVEGAIAEAARVLRPGGTLITTVDKNDAGYATGSDAARLLAPVRSRFALPQRDAVGTIIKLGEANRLAPAGESVFTGHGQGRSPRQWIETIRDARQDWVRLAGPEDLEGALRGLAELPDQDAPRADPVYRLLALERR